MQKPNRPTPQSAKTTARSAHTGLRAKVESRWDVIPRHGRIATYTSACTKNQNKRCHRSGIPCGAEEGIEPARTCGALKKYVPTRRSASRNTQAARRMLNIKDPRIPVRNQAHTVSGIRGKVMPLVRRSMAVTLKFNALNSDATQKSATLTTHSVKPNSGCRKNAVVIPSSEAAVAQNASRFSVGKAISRAPI